MARIRTIKPEFVESESIGKLSRDARLLFVLLWTFVDDAGRARASSRLLASRLYPYDEDAPDLLDDWLGELEEGGHVRRYEVEGDMYLDIPKWLKHQKIDHASLSRLPEFREEFASPRESVAPHTLDLGPRTSTKDLAPIGVVAGATDDEVKSAFAMFNEAAKRTGWPEVRKLDDDRKRMMRARLKDAGGIDGFALVLGKAEASEFLTVKWGKCNLDWILGRRNFRKIMEGNYADKAGGRDGDMAGSIKRGLAEYERMQKSIGSAS